MNGYKFLIAKFHSTK